MPSPLFRRSFPPLARFLLGCAALSGCVVRAPNIESGMRLTEYGRATDPMQPPGVVTDEVSQDQMQLALDQGRAARDALIYLTTEAGVGAEMTAGEFFVGYVFTPPQGYYERGVWHEPTGDARLVISVRDGFDGRTVPALTVRAALTDASGREVFARPMPFGWDPVLDGYADDVPLPAGGAPFRLRVEIDPLQLRRHDPVNGQRFEEDVVAEFADVRVSAAGIAPVRGDPARGQALAAAQGAALGHALFAMIGAEANDGSQTRVDGGASPGVAVAYAVEYAEAFWHFPGSHGETEGMHGDRLQYATEVETSAEKNAHVEVAVRDPSGRFLPGLDVTTTFSRGGRVVSRLSPGLMWHSWLYHYGENIRVPSAGAYTLRVDVQPPPYRLWTRAGDFFQQPVTVTFQDVDVKTGQK